MCVFACYGVYDDSGSEEKRTSLTLSHTYTPTETSFALIRYMFIPAAPFNAAPAHRRCGKKVILNANFDTHTHAAE